VNQRQQWGIFRSDATNIDWIANWRAAHRRAFIAASFQYISCCGMIRTQILNCSESAECAKLWNGSKNRGVGAVRLFDCVKPLAMVRVRLQPGPRTEPQI
jgi:hypothetical protein